MNALQIVLLLLNLASKLFDYFQQQKWIKEGEDRVVAAAAREIFIKTEHAKVINAKIDKMGEAEVDDLLFKLSDPQPVRPGTTKGTLGN